MRRLEPHRCGGRGRGPLRPLLPRRAGTRGVSHRASWRRRVPSRRVPPRIRGREERPLRPAGGGPEAEDDERAAEARDDGHGRDARTDDRAAVEEEPDGRQERIRVGMRERGRQGRARESGGRSASANRRAAEPAGRWSSCRALRRIATTPRPNARTPAADPDREPGARRFGPRGEHRGRRADGAHRDASPAGHARKRGAAAHGVPDEPQVALRPVLQVRRRFRRHFRETASAEFLVSSTL